MNSQEFTFPQSLPAESCPGPDITVSPLTRPSWVPFPRPRANPDVSHTLFSLTFPEPVPQGFHDTADAAEAFLGSGIACCTRTMKLDITPSRKSLPCPAPGVSHWPPASPTPNLLAPRLHLIPSHFSQKFIFLTSTQLSLQRETRSCVSVGEARSVEERIRELECRAVEIIKAGGEKEKGSREREQSLTCL